MNLRIFLPYTLDPSKYAKPNYYRNISEKIERQIDEVATNLERQSSERLIRQQSLKKEEPIFNKKYNNKEEKRKYWEEKMKENLNKNKNFMNEIFNQIGVKISENGTCNICSYERNEFIKVKCCHNNICTNCVYICTNYEFSFQCAFCRKKLIDYNEYNNLMSKYNLSSDNDYDLSNSIDIKINNDHSDLSNCYRIPSE
jgi:hypothetical protein